ncbi:MAG: ATP-binding protein [Rhodomicrobium sp.]
MQTPIGFTEHRRQRLTRLLAALLALILLSIAALAIAAIVRARSDALAKARLEASYISAALDEDVEGALNTLACASQFVAQRIEKEGDTGFLAQLKEQISRNSPALTAISIIGPDGKLRASSQGEAPGSLDFANLEFFTAQRDGEGAGFLIGKPITLSNRTVIPATWRLENNGKFNGAVMFSIDPEIGAATYRRVNLGKTGSIKVLGRNGTILAGYTLPRGYDSALIGTAVSSERALTRWHSAVSGSYLATSPLDGIERVYYWRKITGFPLIAVVGLGKAEAMEGANREAILIASLAILAAALLLGTSSILKREFSRRVKQALALDSHRRKLREANAQLTAAKREAEKASQSKSIFLANISHELRTPLNAILGFAEIIRDQVLGNDPERYARYAADIHKAGSHLLSVIRSLLDLSKIEAAKFELDETRFELDGVVRESFRIVEGQAKAGNIDLRAISAVRDLILEADETALKQILINLLSNAIKFTPEGGSVHLSSGIEADGRLTFTVRDTGMGMSREEILQALEPFGQVRNKAASHREGTGLGLPLAAQLTKLHGGSLEVESIAGHGTTVSVHFPAWRVIASGDRPGHPSSPPLPAS